MSLVADPHNIRLAMLGMVDGNGHPYSWSAIINGRYDAAAMAECGYPVIPQYLSAQPAEALGIPGVAVTHVWCDDPADARKVARAACIPNVVGRPQDVIGQVDAVVIPTDRGWEHVQRAAPFIEAHLPVFIDKPLADNAQDLRQFVQWRRGGAAVMSSSCMRYAREFLALRQRLGEAGQVRLVTITTPKSWRRYGIHALEGVYQLLAPGGWQWVVNSGSEQAGIVHARHDSGVDVLLAAIEDMYGAFGCLNVYGSAGAVSARFGDTFNAFKDQLLAFVQYLRSGQEPFDFGETVEMMKIIIAGVQSLQLDGRRVNLSEIQAE